MTENNSVFTIDCNYQHQEFAAAYLIMEKGKAAFVENNTGRAVPLLMKSLSDHGLKPEQVEYLIVTHVHLDHAGGTSALVKMCPNAAVLAHPRAAGHIIDPARLIAGSKAVYGEETYRRLYPDIEPVDTDRVRSMADGESVKFGGRDLKFIHTLGHAKHHMVMYDSGTNGVFTGDSFGLVFPLVQSGTRLLILPSTTPPDFDPFEADKAVRKIVDTGAERVYLTHYGERTNVGELAGMLTANIGVMADILDDAKKSGAAGDDLERFCYEKMRVFFETEIRSGKIEFSGAVEKFLEMDIRLNARGIAHAAKKSVRE